MTEIFIAVSGGDKDGGIGGARLNVVESGEERDDERWIEKMKIVGAVSFYGNDENTVIFCYRALSGLAKRVVRSHGSSAVSVLEI